MKMPCRFRRDMHPIKRLGTSEDVARAALFLPSMFARVSSRPCRKSLMSETSHPQRGLHLRREFRQECEKDLELLHIPAAARRASTMPTRPSAREAQRA